MKVVRKGAVSFVEVAVGETFEPVDLGSAGLRMRISEAERAAVWVPSDHPVVIVACQVVEL